MVTSDRLLPSVTSIDKQRCQDTDGRQKQQNEDDAEDNDGKRITEQITYKCIKQQLSITLSLCVVTDNSFHVRVNGNWSNVNIFHRENIQ